jgi:hypothetical protein
MEPFRWYCACNSKYLRGRSHGRRQSQRRTTPEVLAATIATHCKYDSAPSDSGMVPISRLPRNHKPLQASLTNADSHKSNSISARSEHHHSRQVRQRAKRLCGRRSTPVVVRQRQANTAGQQRTRVVGGQNESDM